jgi:hypothetical protein
MHLNKVKPILLAYGCPRANDSARLLIKLISTFGGMGGSNGSTYASIIVGSLQLVEKMRPNNFEIQDKHD